MITSNQSSYIRFQRSWSGVQNSNSNHNKIPFWIPNFEILKQQAIGEGRRNWRINWLTLERVRTERMGNNLVWQEESWVVCKMAEFCTSRCRGDVVVGKALLNDESTVNSRGVEKKLLVHFCKKKRSLSAPPVL